MTRFNVSLDDFVERVLPRLLPTDANWAVVERLVLDDLVLAFACQRGDQTALAIFDRECGREFDFVAQRSKLDHASLADLRQQLWQRLLIGKDGPPKVVEYRGTAPIRIWVRVIVAHFLLNEERRLRRERLVFGMDYGELGIASALDPELSLLEQSYRQQFRQAFQGALSDLRPDQRNSLRCHYVLSMSIDQMAEVFGVHRATAARRVAQARGDLLLHTRERLRQELGVATEEIDSVIRIAQGQSSFSVARLLDPNMPPSTSDRRQSDSE